MIRIFKTEEGAVHQQDEITSGSWIALTDPTATEILEIADRYRIDPDDLRAPLDEEERSRIEVEDDYTLILVDIPLIEELISRESYPAPKFWLNPEVKDFYDFTPDDVKLIDYQHGEQIRDIPIAI